MIQILLDPAVKPRDDIYEVARDDIRVVLRDDIYEVARDDGCVVLRDDI
jgi:hypothetical protein